MTTCLAPLPLPLPPPCSVTHVPLPLRQYPDDWNRPVYRDNYLFPTADLCCDTMLPNIVPACQHHNRGCSGANPSPTPGQPSPSPAAAAASACQWHLDSKATDGCSNDFDVSEMRTTCPAPLPPPSHAPSLMRLLE